MGREKESVKKTPSNQYVKNNYDIVPNDNKWAKPAWISEFVLIREEAGELLWKQRPLLCLLLFVLRLPLQGVSSTPCGQVTSPTASGCFAVLYGPVFSRLSHRLAGRKQSATKPPIIAPKSWRNFTLESECPHHLGSGEPAGKYTSRWLPKYLLCNVKRVRWEKEEQAQRRRWQQGVE